MKISLYFFLLSVFFAITFGIYPSSLQAQIVSTNKILIKSGSGTFTAGNWTTFEIGVPDYERGILIVEIVRSAGIAGTFAIFEEDEPLPTGKVMGNYLFSFGIWKIGSARRQFYKPAKFVLGVKGKSDNGGTNTFEYKAYVVNGKNPINVTQNCPECSDRFYIRFSGIAPFSMNSNYGHAWVTLHKLDKVKK